MSGLSGSHRRLGFPSDRSPSIDILMPVGSTDLSLIAQDPSRCRRPRKCRPAAEPMRLIFPPRLGTSHIMKDRSLRISSPVF